MWKGKIEGKAVNDIILDTGCSRTLVRGRHWMERQ